MPGRLMVRTEVVRRKLAHLGRYLDELETHRGVSLETLTAG